MRFFIDANLPQKLALNLRAKGYDAFHTDDLPNKERTTDEEIRKFAMEQERIVITKDSDFLNYISIIFFRRLHRFSQINYFRYLKIIRVSLAISRPRE
jgi:predicted nuclease of predicted toxin-antitoxin system